MLWTSVLLARSVSIPNDLRTTSPTTTATSTSRRLGVTWRPWRHGLVEKTRKHPAAECERCDLYDIGRFVPSDGPPQTSLAVVGEAPGANEARLGHPFVGVSGKLLDKILEHYGIERSATLLTNACLCRPPDNATPSANALHCCRPRLVQELQERGVGKVVALGNAAARSLMGAKDGITRLSV